MKNEADQIIRRLESFLFYCSLYKISKELFGLSGLLKRTGFK